MTDFMESPRFPDNISYGSSGGPNFNTSVFEGHGGVEQRGINWNTVKGKWNVSQGIRDTADMNLIRSFFYGVKGRAIGFRYKDWGDYLLDEEEASGVVDGVNDTFKIIKTYLPESNSNFTYVRRIFKPVEDSITVLVDTTPITVGNGVTEVDIDFETGIMTFGSSVVPAMGTHVYVSGQFDLPVRFDTDALNVTEDSFDTQTWGSIPLVELLLIDE